MPRNNLSKYSVRIVLLRACSETCFFCHEEGRVSHKSPYPLTPKVILDFVNRIKREFGIDLVHLTGGEPTLYPDIVTLVQDLHAQDFGVQITSNALGPVSVYDQLISAGVDALILSVHAVRPRDYAFMQGERLPLKTYSNQLDRKLATVLDLSPKVRTKVNTVIINELITGATLDWALQNNLDIRLMRNLNAWDEGLEIATNLLERRGFSFEATLGDLNQDSGGRYLLFSDGIRIVKIKDIAEKYLTTLCENCPLRGTSKCREKFYGIRLEPPQNADEQARVRLCLDRYDSDAVMPVADFWNSRHVSALRRLYTGV